MLKTSTAQPALAMARAVLSHGNTDYTRRFDSIAAEFGAAWLRRWLAPMACTDGRWLAPMAAPMARGHSGSESPSSLLNEPRSVATKEVRVLGESPAPSSIGLWTLSNAFHRRSLSLQNRL